jgi:hypothetical protein
MDNRRIALVVAKDGSSDSVATGYFIEADLVLTVRHVAKSLDSTFKVRANSVDPTTADPWCEATVIWRGVGDIDALLLRTSRRFGNWDPEKLQHNASEGRWRSSGYALVAADEDSGSRMTQPVSGSFAFSEGQGAPSLALQTEQHLRDSWDTYWRGISGAPIFHSPGNELVGIIVEANRASPNGLVGLPIGRILDDIGFRKAVAHSFLEHLPEKPWCLVLTAEQTDGSLPSEVAGVLSGFRDEEANFQRLQEEPVVLPVLEAIRSVENWVIAVEALAKADYVVADVTGFEPAVMLLLGVRSVLRRGVTVSVTRDNLEAEAPRSGTEAKAPSLPFNVQETRVLSYVNAAFYDDLHRAMAEGAANLARDPNYLDLPAYYGVRTPRSEVWAEENSRTLLMLCPFSYSYTAFFENKLRPIVRAHTRNLMPLRMLDLRSPRLVGQALYEQIRWAGRCIVDWTYWRPNVFFELGVRLACSEDDPLSIVDEDFAAENVSKDSATPKLEQRQLLHDLLLPVPYSRADPRPSLKPVLEAWRTTAGGSSWRRSTSGIPPAATFAVAQASFVWSGDPLLTLPHVEQRQAVEKILGRDPERLPERLALFSNDPSFDIALQNSVRERWIAAWLYLRHLSAREDPDDGVAAELTVIGRLASQALRSSQELRHVELRREITEFLNAERAARRARRSRD